MLLVRRAGRRNDYFAVTKQVNNDDDDDGREVKEGLLRDAEERREDEIGGWRVWNRRKVKSELDVSDKLPLSQPLRIPGPHCMPQQQQQKVVKESLTKIADEIVQANGYTDISVLRSLNYVDETIGHI